MSKWLMEFQSQSQTQNVTDYEPNCAICTNCTGMANQSEKPICANCTICTRGQNLKNQEPICTNCANCTGVQNGKTELWDLNLRWQKALQLEQSGFFEWKSQSYQEKICQELRQIVAKAGELWEFITESCPHAREKLQALELFNF